MDGFGRLAANALLCIKYPNGKIERAEKLVQNSTVEYEVVVEVGEQNYEIVLDASGKILKAEMIGEEEEKEKNKAQGK